MRSDGFRKLTGTAMLLALGFVLPFLTGQIPQIGNLLLPMHIPVFLCGLLCGPQYGAGLGFALPLLRSAVFGMPPIYPIAVSMAFELATYGLVAGLLYARLRWRRVAALYGALLCAMVAGRAVWGIMQTLLLGIGEGGFTWQLFFAGAFLNAIPGILLQLALIPGICVAVAGAGGTRTPREPPVRG